MELRLQWVAPAVNDLKRPKHLSKTLIARRDP